MIDVSFKSVGTGKCRWCKKDKDEVIELKFGDGSFVGCYCFADFKKAKTLIFGISADSIESHGKFKKKMGFPFDLLSDPDNTVCTLYDVIQEKSMYG